MAQAAYIPYIDQSASSDRDALIRTYFYQDMTDVKMMAFLALHHSICIGGWGRRRGWLDVLAGVEGCAAAMIIKPTIKDINSALWVYCVYNNFHFHIA